MRSITARAAASAAARGLRRQRDVLVVALLGSGTAAEDVASLIGLSAHQVGHIRRTARPVPAPPPGPSLTGREVASLVREHHSSPGALEWLASVRRDRRHNGRPMVDRGGP